MQGRAQLRFTRSGVPLWASGVHWGRGVFIVVAVWWVGRGEAGAPVNGILSVGKGGAARARPPENGNFRRPSSRLPWWVCHDLYCRPCAPLSGSAVSRLPEVGVRVCGVVRVALVLHPTRCFGRSLSLLVAATCHGGMHPLSAGACKPLSPLSVGGACLHRLACARAHAQSSVALRGARGRSRGRGAIRSQRVPVVFS